MLNQLGSNTDQRLHRVLSSPQALPVKGCTGTTRCCSTSGTAGVTEEKGDVTAISSHLCSFRKSLGQEQEVVCVSVMLGRTHSLSSESRRPRQKFQNTGKTRDLGAA